jgi:hypothetical protein
MKATEDLKAAYRAEQAGDLDQAQRIYEAIITAAPGSPEATTAGFDLADLRRRLAHGADAKETAPVPPPTDPKPPTAAQSAVGVDGPLPDPKLVGISGWLILPAFSLIVGPILGVLGLVSLASELPALMGSDVFGILLLELLQGVGITLFAVIAAVRFFRKKQSAPSTMIALILVSLASEVLMAMITSGSDTEMLFTLHIEAVLQGLFSAVIWIPYFRVSKRVRATFVNP